MVSLTESIETILREYWHIGKSVNEIHLPKEMIKILEEEVGFIEGTSKIETFNGFDSEYGILNIIESENVKFK